MPFQGVLAPWNNFGNFIGSTTASFNASLAAFNPAISFHDNPDLFFIITSSNSFFWVSGFEFSLIGAITFFVVISSFFFPLCIHCNIKL